MPQFASGEPARNAVSSADDRAAEIEHDDSIGPDRISEARPTRRSDDGGTRPTKGLSNWRVRRKLITVFVVPTVAALFLAGLRVYDGFANIDVYDRAEKRVELTQKTANAIQKLQTERDSMAAWIATSRGDRGDLDQRIRESSTAASSVRDASDDVADIDDDSTTQKYQQALTRLDGLDTLRVSAGDPSFIPLAAQQAYGAVIDALLKVGDEFGSDVTDKGLQNRHEALTFLSDAKEYSAQQNTYLRYGAILDKFESNELPNINTAQANLIAAIDRFSGAATPEARLLYSNTLSGDQVSQRFQIQQLALLRAQADAPLGVDPKLVADTSAATLDKFQQVESDLLAEEASYTGGLVSQERTSVLITSAIIVAGLLVALLLMFVVGRSLLRPLRKLRYGAIDVAEHELPQAVDRIMGESDPAAAVHGAIAPLPVHTTEEIGEVARAFDQVNAQAVRLAAEQAMLRENVNGIFVNLSRRSQRLVERQLGVIDRLEADEQDPDHLASLFELDHLATRLRRNGESLLVLSGAGLAKSVPKPVPAADVIGAAVSEIEQYARVEVGVIPEVAVRGLTVHDLVHVLAELLDNATYFSEPETKVSVRAVVTRKKALAIQITDRGVGMSADQVGEANLRLADPPDLDVSVTRRMGLYVVARLAQRHGIEVRLRENEDIEGGIIARIVVPAELLGPVTADSRPRPPSRQETSSPSLPPVNTLSSGGPSSASSLSSMSSLPSVSSLTPPPPSRPEPEPAPTPPPSNRSLAEPGELRPLDQPISLDDLVGGAQSAAGPFLSPGQAAEEPSVGQNGLGHAGNGNGATGQAAGETTQFSLALPKREPRYVAPEPPAPEPERTEESSALDDDVPTRRLPIYQSVLSRWFSEEEAGGSSAPEERQDPVAAEQATAEPEADGGYEAPLSEPEEVAVDHLSSDSWHSASDDGWQAAQSLLEQKNEEVTTAGLPKRVPNAYLVPGSVNTGEADAFRDTTVGQPGQGAIARSASAARNRMVSFQRGYTTGRHALHEKTAEGHEEEGVSVSGGEQHFPPGTAVRSEE
ncbi:nitrate- and nitrite sensing domain-containing protein [Amycolatopsis minnesotensis]|uniref:histidine kinase n=1 Tax=Amycolatopsis minnesotensis TaxID=337894 RepID=A0ABN2Q109_9PSEU